MLYRLKVKDALLNLLGYRRQSILAILGLIIGCGAFSMNLLLLKSATVTAQSQMSQEGKIRFAIQLNPQERQYYTPRHWESIKEKLAMQNTLVPFARLIENITYRGQPLSATTIATTANFSSYSNKLPEMSALDTSERYCYVGASLTVPVGENIAIGNTFCKVIAVLPSLSPSPVLDFDPNRSILIPLKAMRRFTDRNEIEAFAGYVDTSQALKAAKKTIQDHLTSFSGEYRRAWIDMESLLKGFQKSYAILKQGLNLVAFLSFLVGMVNLMNLLQMNLSQRLPEFGIRQALGARKEMLYGMIGIEVAFLLMIGGIIGSILGISMAAVGAKLLHWHFSLDIPRLLVVLMLNLVVGLLALILPIRQIAKKSPLHLLQS